MIIKQLSVFVENKQGRLAEISEIIANHGINIQALSIADTTDFGILRIIIDDADKACELLRKDGLTVSVCDVLSVNVSHAPGGLSTILKKLAEGGVLVEYVYAFASNKTSDDAMIVIRADDTQKAYELLK